MRVRAWPRGPEIDQNFLFVPPHTHSPSPKHLDRGYSVSTNSGLSLPFRTTLEEAGGGVELTDAHLVACTSASTLCVRARRPQAYFCGGISELEPLRPNTSLISSLLPTPTRGSLTFLFLLQDVGMMFRVFPGLVRVAITLTAAYLPEK